MKDMFRLRLLLLAALLLAACEKTQDQKEESILDVPASVSLPYEGGFTAVQVKATGDWSAYCDSDWLSFTPQRGTGDGEITVSAGPNNSMESLTAELVLVSGKISDTCLVILEAQEVTRLDSEGRSNCYILPENGTKYAFDCRFRGNSETEQVGDIDAVSIIWQTSPGLVRDLGLDKESGLVTFTTGTSNGNALLAVKDSGGRILWSWHLWVCAFDPRASSFASPDKAGHSWTFMDRNLGALTSEKGDINALGLLYQWGRKDPFPGVGSVSGDEPCIYDGDGNELPSVPSRAASFGTVQLSIEHPDVFYKISYNTQDWTDVSDDNYWGGVEGKKTIWDPCPPGWMMPVCAQDGTSPYDFLDKDNTEWDEENGGRYYAPGNWWLPAGGTRVYESGELSYIISGPYGGMWLGTAGKASDDLETNPQRYGQYLFIIDGRMFKVMKDIRSQGMSVRCVREQQDLKF